MSSEILCAVNSFHAYAGEDGTLDVLGQRWLPFAVVRSFCVANVPAGQWRGNHAHRKCRQILWSVSGSWRIVAEPYPGEERIVDLHERADALYVPARTWVKYASCSRLGVLVAYCSEIFDPEDYWREYGAWKREVRG